MLHKLRLLNIKYYFDGFVKKYFKMGPLQNEHGVSRSSFSEHILLYRWSVKSQQVSKNISKLNGACIAEIH